MQSSVTPQRQYVDSIKDDLLVAALEVCKKLEPETDIGLVLWSSDGTELFSRGGTFANFARGKCRAVRHHGIKHGWENALKYVRDPTQGFFPFCFFLCCTVPDYTFCSGELNVIGVTMFRVDNEYFIFAGSGAKSPANDVKVPEGGIEAFGFVKGTDGIYSKNL